ncbi:MAG: ATP-binding cassette domain-containing protein [Oceanipulchritudo sp.]
MKDDFLQLEDVCTWFPITKGFIRKRTIGHVRAVDGIRFSMKKGEILGLVGESGCGKTTLSRTIMQLQPATSGKIRLEGTELTALPAEVVRRERLNFQMIFQDPHASLNPRLTVYDTLSEAVRTRHEHTGRKLADAVGALMKTVGLNPAQMKKYPHEFSGGQRQRIAVARALAPEPRLIIADEPVSALDVSIQSQILNLLKRLTAEMGLTMIFISHDLSVVKYISDRIAVMYLGRLVELGEATEIMERPYHPYTRALISAVPVPDPDVERSRKRLVLEGDPPTPLFMKGAGERPRAEMKEVSPGHYASDPEAFLEERQIFTGRV